MAMKLERPCLTSRCPEYAVPGESRCQEHQAEWEAQRRADPNLTGRRGTTAEWRRARGLSLWRHKRTCQDCGLTEAQLRLVNGRLEVHHVDGDATNNRQSNLVPLCSLGCHRRAGLR
ncbi:MAG: HNH endonuclease [Nannocystis sp.]|nr:HNH endonuclease signature motif containing protein [Nannocystis sp.]MBA3546069.1 HNH endonuclease [Nannocystis sp.]